VLSFMSQSDGLDSIILLASYDRFQVMQNMRAAELANHELQAAYREAASFLAGRTTRHIVPVPYVG